MGSASAKPLIGERNVLLVAFDAPPQGPVGASIRLERFARYLPDFGWRPSLVTRAPSTLLPPDRTTVVAGAARVARSDQLAAWAWARRLSRMLPDVLRARRPDLVFVTAPPHPPSLAVVQAARRAARPVVVDFRDAWSLDPHPAHGVAKQALKRFLSHQLYRRLERRMLRDASWFVGTTPSMIDAYRAECDSTPSTLIPNGYDEADFTSLPSRPGPFEGTWEFVHAGRFHGVGARRPDGLVSAFVEARRRGVPVRLTALGDVSPALRSLIRTHDADGAVRCLPPLPHREALKVCAQAHALVVYQEPSRSSITPVAGKTYEALRLGRPILGVVPPGDNADAIRSLAPHAALVLDGRMEHVVHALGSLVDQLEASAPPTSPSAALAAYERRALTGRLASLFDACLERSRQGDRAH